MSSGDVSDIANQPLMPSAGSRVSPRQEILSALHLLKHLFHVGYPKLALLLQRVELAGRDLVAFDGIGRGVEGDD